jgi:hypothetical protein
MLKTPQNKALKAVRPHFTARASFMPKIDVKVDFDMTDISTGSGSYTDLGQSVHNSATLVQNATWTSVNAEGYSFSVILQGTATQQGLEFHALDLMYEKGGFL